MAPGIDQLGFEYAFSRSMPVANLPSNWLLHGRSAGPKRNKKIAQYAEALILIWDGKSPGSRNMLKEARSHGLKIFEVIV